MNALDEIVKKVYGGKKLTEIELAIHWVWNETGTKNGIAYEAAVANAAMQARIEKLERVEKIARQIYKLFSKTEIIDIDEQYFNVWSIVGDAEKNELEAALRNVT